VIAGIIWQKSVLTHASIVCGGMLASVNLWHWHTQHQNTPSWSWQSPKMGTRLVDGV